MTRSIRNLTMTGLSLGALLVLPRTSVRAEDVYSCDDEFVLCEQYPPYGVGKVTGCDPIPGTSYSNCGFVCTLEPPNSSWTVWCYSGS